MTAKINVRKMAQSMLDDADAFEERANKDDKYPILSGQPWCVTTEDASLAILVKHADDGTFSMHPTFVQTHLCGFSCLSRRDAQVVLKYYKDAGYVLTLHRDIARIRAADLRETAEFMLANIDQMEVA